MDTFLNTFLLAYSAFIPVLNPFGGAMFLLALTPGLDDLTRGAMVRRIVFYSAIILFASLFAGHLILSFFGISLGVLRICGGIVLFYAGWSALNAPAETGDDDGATSERKKPLTYERVMSMAFYPLTLPLTMGPGVISVATAMGAGIFEGGLMAFAGLMSACVATLATVFICYRLPLTMGPGVISVATAMGAGIFEGGLMAFAGLMSACVATLATVFICYRYCDRLSRAVGAAGADAISRIFAFILICIGTGVFWQGLSEQIASMPTP